VNGIAKRLLWSEAPRKQEITWSVRPRHPVCDIVRAYKLISSWENTREYQLVQCMYAVLQVVCAILCISYARRYQINQLAQQANSVPLQCNASQEQPGVITLSSRKQMSSFVSNV